MDIRPGQTAVITGAGSGIGQALALACASRGMRVMVADIELAAAECTAEQVRSFGTEAVAIQVDVGQPDQVERLAQRCWLDFGECHLLCNNAGVSVSKKLHEHTPADWQWVISVNTLAVGYAISAFVPRMRTQANAHIVNTASMAGLVPLPEFGAYVASKYAVVGLSEVLAQELAGDNIGVSVLCPGIVKTRIYESDRNRPNHQASPPEPSAEDNDGMQTAFDMAYTRMLNTKEVADLVISAVTNNQLYVPTHPEWLPLFENRVRNIKSAFQTPAPTTKAINE